MSQKPEKTNELQAFPLLSHAIELRRRLMISLFAVGLVCRLCVMFCARNLLLSCQALAVS
jgi:Sec-independent protein secretion pathway component TatC